MSSHQIKISYGNDLFVIKLMDFLSINLTLIVSARLFLMGDFDDVIMISLLFSTSFLLIGEYIGLYHHRVKSMQLRGQQKLWGCALLSVTFVETVRGYAGTLYSLGLLHHLDNIYFSATLYWYTLSLLVLYLVRLMTVKYTAKKRIRVAIVGLTPGGLAAEKALRKEYANMQLELAFYDDRSPARFGYLIKSEYKGNVSVLVEEAKAGRVDEIYIALPMIALKRIRYFLSMMSDTTVDTYIIPDLYSYSSYVSQLRSINNIQTISIFKSPFDGIGSVIKRLEDLVIGGVITLMISPLLLLIAIGIKLTSPGPVLFKQDRYGLSGNKIKVWKFRSMHVMENSDVVKQATKNDPRVTRFGAFLRRTSLDELPQFFNVLQGTMSIVGPRPHAVVHNEQYRQLVENYMIRHKVKPGISGLAQVNGYRGEVDTLDKMEKRVYYDITYIQSWSLWLDLKIIFRTIFKGFVGENAY
ncbi:undecaprenyl-phosphate glucose phosphotransferase [Dickeya zeae]|uniref:Undecaprenyl-phosphate glucose phosphotransferase n=1 Tax=Dickeya zeae (strain Ech586) TaxID=590409 RepID=D2BRK4_DICZ5|nr:MULTISPECIES: undecaprenyl-phosphate glucose phosphotransferase [Dickeya]ACZ75408.1 Undecaprenyl-phosphate glucose phosphotransferase [Dickeya parazeae Ech586]UCZ76685.1 undecaprenyl-phosphate glucose phosphotransferase [Dickeya zeae]